MTAKELIQELQKLGEENLDKEIIMFNDLSYYTPYKVEVLTDEKWRRHTGKILID